MAVPKKKRSKSCNGMRWSHKKVTHDALSSCTHCGAAKRSHHICGECGYYKGKMMIEPKALKKKADKEPSA